MNQWPNDSNPTANGHATLASTPNNQMSFPHQPQTINPAHFQQTQAFLNGASRTSSPAFQQSMYQTNQVIPSKRSREDSLGKSPRLSHNAPPGSRSQTPGQAPFPGFNATNGATPFTSAPSAFSHLQATNGATPSPTMQQMAFSNNAATQRVSTASPSPFSPQHGITAASPAPSDHTSRVGTPHDALSNFASTSGSNSGFNPQIISSQAPPSQMHMPQPQMSHAGMTPQQLYHRQVQQMQRQAPNGAPHTPQSTAGDQPDSQQEAAPSIRIATTPQEFFKGLQQFSIAKGRPLDMRPQICGRQVDALRMYQAIMKGGGSTRITKHNQWPLVAQTMQIFPQQQWQLAAAEMQHYWMNNIGAYEQMWLQQQKQRQAQIESPTRDSLSNGVNHQRAGSDAMSRQMNGQTPNMLQQVNGAGQPHKEVDSSPSHQRQNSSRQLDLSVSNSIPSETYPDTSQKRSSSAIKLEADLESTMPIQKSIEDPFAPDVLEPSRFHGPVNVEEMFLLGQQIVEMKPTVPSLRELGVIDIHALNMAIKSGLHGETRNALDTLVTLSSEPSLQIQLDMCDDLMETLVDCAQVEVDFLAEHASEVSEEISLPSYEELVRSSHLEAKTVQSIPEFGSREYDLDRAVDRLICITTLIRNFSFYEPNFVTLGQPEVLQLVTRVIQHIGTKDMPLRNPRNTLDFMKDTIIYLSNLSSSLYIPSKQDALCLLHFLLAFAPNPSPMSSSTDKIAFAAYSPSVHKYLPPAIDSLAKLLARDEPNRMYYKAIFVADGRAAPQYELLTRAFGLVIAAVPHTTAHVRAQIESRKPFLLQGLLAAEILASLAPGTEHPLVRSWLQSEDCFAGNILKMASALSTASGAANSARQQNGRNERQRHDDDPLAHGSIVNRTMAILRTLVHKSRTADDEGNISATGVPSSAIMRKETLLGAMIQKDIDAGMLRLFCHYAGTED